ncbi:MAG: PAS domain S-box protein [Nitrospinae bacterium]|nr:PAS domain S-box protein [Nitrospinota bacterium]
MLAVSLAIVIFSWRQSIQQVQSSAQYHFDLHSDLFKQAIFGEIVDHEYVMRGMLGYWMASGNDLGTAKWDEYLNYFAIFDKYKAFRALAVAKVETEPNGQIHVPVTFTRLLDPHAPISKGADLAASPFHGPLVDKVLKTGFIVTSSATRAYTLEGVSGPPRIFIYMMLDAGPSNPGAQAKHKMLVIALIDLNQLIAPVPQTVEPGMGVEVYEGKNTDTEHFLGGYTPISGPSFWTAELPLFEKLEIMEIGDTPWTFRFFTTPSYKGDVDWDRPFYVLAFGVTVSLLLFIVALVITSTHMRAVAMAAEMSKEWRKSEERFKTLVDSMDEMVFTLDKEQRHTGLYGKGLAAAGVAPEDFIGKTAQEIYGEDNSDIHGWAFQRALAGESASYEWSTSGPGGAPIYFHTSVTPILDSKGEITGAVGVGRDISSLVQARKEIDKTAAALKLSEAKYRAVFERSPFGVVLGDEKGRIVHANPAFCHIVGYSEDELASLRWADFTHPHDLELNLSLFREMVQGRREFFTIEERCIHKSGGIEWVNVASTAVRDDTGAIKWVITLVEDISKRKRIEKELLESEQKYRRIFTNSIDAICVFDREKQSFLDANESFLKLYGYSMEELLKMPLDTISSDPGKAREYMEQAATDGDIKLPLRWHRKKDGEVFPVEISAGPFSWKGRDVIFAMIRDISDRVKAEERIEGLKNFYSNILESVISGVLVTDASDTVTYANRGMTVIAGVSLASIVGENVFSALQSETAKPFREYYEKTKTGLAPIFFDSLAIATPAGRATWQSGWLVPMVKDGAFDGMIFTADDITERKAVEEEIRRLEERRRVLLETMAQGVIYMDSGGGVVSANPAARDILGIEEKTMYTLKAPAPFTPAVDEHWRRVEPSRHPALRAVLSGKESRDALIGVENPVEGRIKWIKLHAMPIFEEDSAALSGAFVTFEDITSLKETQERLSDTLSELSIILENAGAGIAWTIKRHWARVNNKFEEMFGYSRDEIIGQSTRNIYTDQETHERLGMEAYDVMKAGETYSAEGRMRRKSGELFWCHLIGRALDPANVEKGVIWILQDLTEHKVAEDALRESERKYRNIINTTSEGFWMVNPQFEMVEVNLSLLEMLGYTIDEMIGKKPYEFADERNAAIIRSHADIIHTTTHRVFDVTLRAKNGMGIPVIINAATLGDAEGKVIGEAAFATNISGRKQAEQELLAAKENAEDATKLKDKFISLVAHDLRSPFASILGLLKLIDEDRERPLHPEHREIIGKIIESGGNLTRMIGELLSISRLKTGTITPKPRFLDGFAIVARVAGGLSYLAQNKGIAVVNQVQPDYRIYADPDLFSEVIHNMVSNAIKFSRKGDRITIFAPEESVSTLAVQDTGTGISPENIQRIFIHEEKTSQPGTAGELGSGLGLPLSSDIMRAHGGSLGVESELGKGSTFFASLPPTRPLVLAVDDEPVIRFMIKEQLRAMDVDIMEAGDVDTAIEMLRQRKPHLVITDISMPGKDGFSLVAHIKTAMKEIPVMVITSDSRLETREKAFKMGADDFITKQMDPSELIPRARRLLIARP